MVGPRSYHSNLVFSSLDRSRGDEGDYTCTASVMGPGSPTPATASVSTIIAIHSEYRASCICKCIGYGKSDIMFLILFSGLLPIVVEWSY